MTVVLVVREIASPAVERAAQAVLKGVADAGASAVVAVPSDAPALDAFGLIFVGCAAFGPLAGLGAGLRNLVEERDWEGKKVCVFAVCSGSGRKEAGKLAAAIQNRGGRVLSTLALELKGLMAFAGKGELSETDLARAYAFGERYAAGLTGERHRKEKTKERIRGYKKQEMQ